MYEHHFMKFSHIKFILFSTALLLSAIGIRSQVKMDVKLDSAHLVMGRTTMLHLDLTKPKDAKGNLTLFKEVRENGIIPVCGDSVEFRAPIPLDTVVSGSNVIIKYDIPVQAFDSGYFRLPELLYVSGNDTSCSKSLSLKVVPVTAKAEDPIHDYASVSDPEDKSIFDYLPDWIVDYWWLFLVCIAAVASGIWLLKRYRKEGHILPKKPEPTPYEKAMASLRKLKEGKLWEQGMEKEYYTDLTDILRAYLRGRFGINAMEMTSREILHAFHQNKEIREYRSDMRQILDMADFVKFAKVRPLPDDCVKSYDFALNFVQSTKPVPVADDESGNGVAGRSKTPSGKSSGKPAKTRKQVKKGGDK